MAFGALFSKTWRVHKIFTAKRAIKRKVRDIKIKDLKLSLYLLPPFTESPEMHSYILELHI